MLPFFVVGLVIAAASVGWDHLESKLVASRQETGTEQEQTDDEEQAPVRGKRGRRLLLAGAGLLVAGTGLAVHLVRRNRRKSAAAARKREHKDDRKGPRIPLREVVRFREKQWFLEELENARDGDANSMLRLAKMYLYGQGCERNVNIALEWLRKARALGIPCTLDELMTAEDIIAFKESQQQKGRSASMPSGRRQVACMTLALHSSRR